MQGNEYKKELHYIRLMEEYEGYVIEYAVSQVSSQSGQWMGHFRATKKDTPTIFGSIANTQATDGRAQDHAIETAKAMVDKAIAQAS